MRYVAHLVAVAALLAPALSPALTTQLEVGALGFGARTYGQDVNLLATLRYSGPACPTEPGLLPVLRGKVNVTLNGIPHGAWPFYSALWRECVDGKWEAGAILWLGRFDIGTHQLAFEYTGEAGLDRSEAAPRIIEVAPDFMGTMPNGHSVAVGFSPLRESGSGLQCTPDQPAFNSQPVSTTAPAGRSFPYGFVNYRLWCDYVSDFPERPPVPPTPVEHRMQLVYPYDLPSTATVWIHARDTASPTPYWRRLEASIRGRHVTVTLPGGMIGMVASPDNLLRGSLGISVSPAFAGEFDFGGMWWGGPGEDGWGLALAPTVSQGLFGVLYIYDGEGRPTWLAFNGARSVDPGRSGFAGPLVQQISRAGHGTEVGSASVDVSEFGIVTLDYSIFGARGKRTIAPMPLQAGSARARQYAGVWDEVPQGGGLTLIPQGDGFFVGWPSLDAAGTAAWLVMPAGTWTSTSSYAGTLFRATAAPWVGTPYDASRLRVVAVGRLEISFDGAHGGTIVYDVDGVSGTNVIQRRY